MYVCVYVMCMLYVWYMHLWCVCVCARACVWYVCVCVCLSVGCSHRKNDVSVLTDHPPDVLFHDLLHASEEESPIHHHPYFWDYSHIAAIFTGFLLWGSQGSNSGLHACTSALIDSVIPTALSLTFQMVDKVLVI